MSLISELRPVEALYLLAIAEKERIGGKNALAAVLAYLRSENYIKHTNGKFILTEENYQESSLRPYEKNILKYFNADNMGKPEALVDFVSDKFFKREIRDYITQKGFLRREEIVRSWLLLEFVHINYFPTEKFNQAIEELDDLKNQIIKESKENTDKDLVSIMSHAFPSLQLNDDLEVYCSKVLERWIKFNYSTWH